jgi:prepilin-type N-terminal cleavage/methylation domain-containing protein
LNKSGPELSFTGEVFNTQEQVMSNSSRDRWEKKKEKGLSLIELMVGLAILGLIIMFSQIAIIIQ